MSENTRGAACWHRATDHRSRQDAPASNYRALWTGSEEAVRMSQPAKQGAFRLAVRCRSARVGLLVTSCSRVQVGDMSASSALRPLHSHRWSPPKACLGRRCTLCKISARHRRCSSKCLAHKLRSSFRLQGCPRSSQHQRFLRQVGKHHRWVLELESEVYASPQRRLLSGMEVAGVCPRSAECHRRRRLRRLSDRTRSLAQGHVPLLSPIAGRRLGLRAVTTLRRRR